MAESMRAIGRRRGYIAISIRERGPVGRGMAKEFNAAREKAWVEAAVYFDTHFAINRFTPEHGRKAGYAARRGQNLTPDSKAFKRSYYGRKLASDQGGGRGQANPLVSSGKAKRAVARGAKITATRKQARVSYSGVPFNFRHPNSRVRMDQEFRRLITPEIQTLARVYDVALDRELNRIQAGN